MVLMGFIEWVKYVSSEVRQSKIEEILVGLPAKNFKHGVFGVLANLFSCVPMSKVKAARGDTREKLDHFFEFPMHLSCR